MIAFEFDWKSILDYVLNFVYSFAHLVGIAVLALLRTLLPSVPIPDELVDPIGFLAIITAFLILVNAAKKIAWIIVFVGWGLLIIRVVLVMLGGKG